MSDPTQAPAGWYDDGSGQQRWWDGTQWGPFADQPAPPVTPAAPTSRIGRAAQIAATAATAARAATTAAATAVNDARKSTAAPEAPTAPGPRASVAAKKPWFKNPLIWIAGVLAVLAIIIAVNAINEGRNSESQPAVAPTPTSEIEAISVPDVLGQDGETAEAALTDLGFTVEFDAGDDSVWSPGNWTVDTQSPAAGSEAAEGDTITLTVSKPSAPEIAEPEGGDPERSAQLEQSIKNALGVQESFTELYASDPSLWGGYISEVRVEGSLAYITLQIAADESHRDEYGQQAAKALSTLLSAEDVQGIDWLIVEDASHVVIDQAQPKPIM